jgi:sialidase-1
MKQIFNEDQLTWESIATGSGHGIELENGRLLVPFWLSESSHSWSHRFIGTIYSDDGGKMKRITMMKAGLDCDQL